MKVHEGKLNPDLKYWCFYLLAHFYYNLQPTELFHSPK